LVADIHLKSRLLYEIKPSGNTAYHTQVTPGVFILSAALSLGVALLTIGCQSIRAAGTDPAVSIRNE